MYWQDVTIASLHDILLIRNNGFVSNMVCNVSEGLFSNNSDRIKNRQIVNDAFMTHLCCDFIL